MKRCIFYLPYKLEKDGKRARMIRPVKMIHAFQENGYEVFCITGYATERKKAIRILKRRIKSGEVYDFMYAEASTMPMLLTEPHHLPIHPYLDAAFFTYVKRMGIPIGLFYPDVYWRFPEYGEGLSFIKKQLGIINYQIDLKIYEKTLHSFYLPSWKMGHYVGSRSLMERVKELPPGTDLVTVAHERQDLLTVFYVGGLGGHYRIEELLKAIRETPSCRAVICCREDEWNREKETYLPILCDRVEIIHKSGKELELYYNQADIGALMFPPMEYRDFAMPVKAFEYLAHELPMLATKGSSVGEFVEKHGLGWTLKNTSDSISELLETITRHPEVLDEKRSCCSKEIENNTWRSRAQQVAEDLKTT